MISPRGTVYGFEVSAPQGFTFTRSGTGRPLEVIDNDLAGPGASQRLVTSLSTPYDPFDADLYADGPVYRLRVRDVGWFVVDPDAGRIAYSTTADDLTTEAHLWGLPALLCAMRHGDVVMRATAVEVGGEAILLANATGGCTQALTTELVRQGHRVLSSDLTCIRTGAETVVLPGPASLDLHRSGSQPISVPGASHVCHTKQRDVYSLSQPADGGPVRLRAVYLLRPARAGSFVAPAHEDTLRDDLGQVSFTLPEPADLERRERGLDALAGGSFAYDLHCPATAEGIPAAVRTITEREVAYV